MAYQFRQVKTIQHNNTTEKVIQVNHTAANKDITLSQMSNIYHTIMNEAQSKGKNIQILMRGLNADKWNFIKGYDDTFDDGEDVEEYYRNKVKNPQKFEQFGQIQIYVRETDKTKVVRANHRNKR